jgi:macrolide-specific efflux system membrane fusion protein
MSSMKIPRRVLINGGLAVVIVVALVIAGILLFKPFPAAGAGAVGTLLTGTVQQGTVSSTVSASGSISEVRDVTAGFGVSGTIASVDVAVGSTVTAGQTLGTLDTTDLQATASTDYTAYVYANQDLAAAEAQPNAQVSQINQAKLSASQARTTYNHAKANLAQATLTAPISGLVIAVNGEVGGSAGGTGSSSSSSGASGSGGSATGSSSGSSGSGSSSGSAFVTIADISSYVVTTNIAEADIAKVTVGQAATITFPALTGTTATAKVTAISPTATTSNSVVTYATTITLDKIPAGLRLGQTAEVAITIASSAPDALYVPAAAITTANGTSTVKVVDAKTDKTVVTDVTLGVVGDDGTEIKTGLTAGETIVIGTVAPTTTTGTNTGTGTRTGTRGGFGGFGGGTGGFPGGRTGGFGNRNGTNG